MMEVLDLFSAAAGGWSLGMHRAGFKTIAACENVDWRRALYQQNNPEVLIYDDVRTLTADRIIRDTGRFPPIVVGSPPCQDISSANTKGKGVEGDRSGLYFEAIRIIGEGRPRWFALENSSNLRTRGADAVLAALEALGYACWTFVVRAGDIGANHERPRSWIIGCDVSQVSYANYDGQFPCRKHAEVEVFQTVECDAGNSAQVRCGQRWQRRSAFPAEGAQFKACGNDDERTAANTKGLRSVPRAGHDISFAQSESAPGKPEPEMGGRPKVIAYSAEPWSGWNGGLTGHLQLDDGLSAWLASTRVALGTPKGTSAASLIVEAFGDAVVPQIPEAIGNAIMRTERALSAIYGRTA